MEGKGLTILACTVTVTVTSMVVPIAELVVEVNKRKKGGIGKKVGVEQQSFIALNT